MVGPGDDVHMPRVSSLLDYEGELAIVIGRRCRHVPVEQRPRGDRRLHDRQRRVGAGLAAADPDDDDGQVVRHARPARPLDRDGRRARRSARPRHQDVRQRRAAPGWEHARDGVRLLRAGRPPVRGLHARAGRRDRDRHAGRRGRRPPAVPRGALEGRRRRPRSRSTASERSRTRSWRSPTATSYPRPRTRCAPVGETL